MSSTILTVIVLVVMWIVVLLPMVVRRPDEPAEAPAEPAAPVSTPRAAMLARRRRTLGTLLALVPGTAAAGVLVSSRLWLANVVCDLLLAGYLGWLRAEARRAAAVRTRRTAQGAAAPTSQPAPVRPPASAPPTHAVDLDDDDPSFAQLDELYPRAVNA
jgi:hypothetical protein